MIFINCVFCKTDEKETRYMLKKDGICICDKCILLLSEKLAVQLKKDEGKMINDLNHY